MNKATALLASFLLIAPMAASAATGVGPVKGEKSFTISGSGVNDNDFNNGSYGVTAELGYFLTDKWQAGVRQSLNGFGGEDVSNSWNGATRGYIQYNFLDGKYRPYLGVSLGGIYGENVTESGTAGVEGGLKMYVLDKTYINLGMEYSYLFESSDDFDSSSNDGLFFYNIGIGFNF